MFWLSGGLGRIVQLELYRAFAKKLMTDAKNTFDSHTGTDAENCTLRLLRASLQHRLETLKQYDVPGGPGGGVLGSGFAGYVPLASQNPHPIIVYSVANYKPNLSHFWANVIVISRTEFNASRLF